MLADRSLAPASGVRDFLVAFPLEQLKRNLALMTLAVKAEELEDALVEGARRGEIGDTDGDVVDGAHRRASSTVAG